MRGRVTLLFALNLAAAFQSGVSLVSRVSAGVTLRASSAVDRLQQSPVHRERSTATVLRQSSSSSSSPGDSSPGGAVNGGGGLVTQQSDVVRTQLFSAFTNLGVADQYDAVLTGLCAKILDNTGITETQAAVSLQDCTDLLREMNEQKIAASPRSLMAMIDSTVKTQDAKLMASVMSLCLRNVGGIRQYGSQQAELLLFPASPTTKVLCPDGKRKTIAERLASVQDVPTDDRGTEIASAAAFAATAASCEVTNLFGMSDVQPLANAVLALMVAVTAVDNFYDLLKTGSQLAVRQLGKESGAVSDFKLPEKDTLPLGLGSGAVTGSVVRGLTRLLTVDAERESQCEAAALYTAYVLGLPCFAFCPNALEASVLVAESAANAEKGSNAPLDNLLTTSGILRVLVWLMAAPAMESMTHPQLIMSDPREAEGFLQRLEDYFGADRSADLFWVQQGGSGESTRADLFKWAYTEADLLLRANKAVVSELSNRLTSGAATIGDCIAVVEGW